MGRIHSTVLSASKSRSALELLAYLSFDFLEHCTQKRDGLGQSPGIHSQLRLHAPDPKTEKLGLMSAAMPHFSSTSSVDLLSLPSSHSAKSSILPAMPLSPFNCPTRDRGTMEHNFTFSRKNKPQRHTTPPRKCRGRPAEHPLDRTLGNPGKT